MKKHVKLYKAVACILLGVFSLFCFCIVAVTDTLPESIFILNGSSKALSSPFSCLYGIDYGSQGVISLSGDSLSGNINIESKGEGKTQLHVDLFGFIPLKNISVTVGDERMLVPGGQSIGVMLYTDGALIVGCSDIELSDGSTVNPGRDAGLAPGDVIKMVNGVRIQNAAHLSKIINSIAYGNIELLIERDGREHTVLVRAAEDSYDNMFRLGLWVRDSTAGVGTLTYYDPVTNMFGGLGHAITDVDTGETLSVRNGEVIFSDVIEVVKSSEGSPGALKSCFDPTREVFARIRENTQYGLYGSCEYSPENNLYDLLPAASHNQVHTGDATILCSIDPSGVKEYSCEIISTSRQFSPAQKSFVIEVKDDTLLNATGGIVQGMSGSPVLQDGRIVGAVTHVIVNQPKTGYGLYIDWMLNEMEN